MDLAVLWWPTGPIIVGEVAEFRFVHVSFCFVHLCLGQIFLFNRKVSHTTDPMCAAGKFLDSSGVYRHHSATRVARRALEFGGTMHNGACAMLKW
mgnify:CR=1 FL=1